MIKTSTHVPAATAAWVLEATAQIRKPYFEGGAGGLYDLPDSG
jgi:hypothetical protein